MCVRHCFGGGRGWGDGLWTLAMWNLIYIRTQWTVASVHWDLVIDVTQLAISTNDGVFYLKLKLKPEQLAVVVFFFLGGGGRSWKCSVSWCVLLIHKQAVNEKEADTDTALMDKALASIAKRGQRTARVADAETSDSEAADEPTEGVEDEDMETE